MATQAIMNFFISASLVHVIGMFHSLQIMCFQTMMNLQYPANAQVFSAAVINILNVDILDPSLINDLLFDFKANILIMDTIPDDSILIGPI